MSTCPGALHAPRRCFTGSSSCKRRSARKTSGRSGVASSPSRSPLQPTEIFQRLRAQFGDDVLATEEVHGHAVVNLRPERYQELAEFLRDDPAFDFDFFDFLTGAD